MNPLLISDSYKTSHHILLPEGTTKIYSNLTPRGSRDPDVDKVVFFGLQYFIKEYLIKQFQENFFNRDIEEIIDEFRSCCFMDENKVRELHNLGYLPIKIKALPEGSMVPLRVPVLTITNTLPEFYWLTNYLETLMSTSLWLSSTSATSAYKLRRLAEKYWEETTGDSSFVDWQIHDFSCRGMSSVEAGIMSGMAHLCNFNASDTISAIRAVKEYYNENVPLINILASEHACMSSGTSIMGSELEYYRHLVQKVKTGILALVSDTYNYWDVLTEILPELKEDILNRESDENGMAKVCPRGDSGDPVKIICGYHVENINCSAKQLLNKSASDSWLIKLLNSLKPETDCLKTTDGKYFNLNLREIEDERAVKGTVELLWETFGGTTVNGYKVLNERVGAVYGDGMNYDRIKRIFEGLKLKGFAPTVCLGVGSFFYTMTTRDQYHWAVKNTYTEYEGKGYDVYKKPITDDGTKHSAKGLLRVDKVDGEYVLSDQVSEEEEQGGELVTVFENGELLVNHNFSEIRERLTKIL